MLSVDHQHSEQPSTAPLRMRQGHKIGRSNSNARTRGINIEMKSKATQVVTFKNINDNAEG